MFYASAKDMLKFDELAIENGIDALQMMELAGWHVLSAVAHLGIEKGSNVVVLAGRGGNGSDGLAAARHLRSYGYHVDVVLASSKNSAHVVHHLLALSSMKIQPIHYRESPEAAQVAMQHADVVIDALVGCQLDGAPRGSIKDLIELVGTLPHARVVSYDVPSGIDATSGETPGEFVSADTTIVLGLPKQYMENHAARQHSGTIIVADVGVPSYIYDQIRQSSRPDFRAGLVLPES